MTATITQIESSFPISSLSALIASVMQSQASRSWLITADPLTVSGGVSHFGATTLDVATTVRLYSAVPNILLEVADVVGSIERSAGRYIIAPMPTIVGLPNNRQSWNNFGVLVEDCIQGLIPEYTPAKGIVLQQGLSIDNLSVFLGSTELSPMGDWSLQMVANITRQSLDIFE